MLYAVFWPSEFCKIFPQSAGNGISETLDFKILRGHAFIPPYMSPDFGARFSCLRYSAWGPSQTLAQGPPRSTLRPSWYGAHWRATRYDKLDEEMLSFATEPPFMSAYKPVKRARQCHGNVSVHTYDARYRKFTTIATAQTTTIRSGWHSSPRTTISTLCYGMRSRH